MPDVEAQILEIRGRINDAQRRRIRAEHERDAAQAAADQARARLLEEFDVDNDTDARALLATLTTERDAAYAQLAAQLDQAGV